MLGKVLLCQLLDVLRNQAPIFVRRESIKEHSQALIPPQPDKALGGLKAIRRGLRETVVDPRQVPQVEDVVEFGGSWWEVSDYSLVQVHCGCGDWLGQLLYVCKEYTLHMM